MEPTFEILSRLPDVKQRGPQQWAALCPLHGDHRMSLEVGVGRDGKALLCCQAGCETPAILQHLGLGWSALFPTRPGDSGPRDPSRPSKPKGKVVARYAYHGPDGALRFWVCRMEPKDFRQCRPDETGLGVIWDMKGVERCLYHSDEIARAPLDQTVYLVEGEKDADNLRRGKLLATTNPGGAGKWHTSHSEQLRGRPVVIIPDVDKPQATGRLPGMDHALTVCHALNGIAASVKLLSLPPLPCLVPKWDVSDWIAAGGTLAQFHAAVEACPLFDPTAHPKPAGAAAQALDGTPNESDYDPHRLARIFVDQHAHPDGLTLRFYRENWYRWHSTPAHTAYEIIPAGEVRAMVAAALKVEFDRLNIERLKTWVPDPKKDFDPPPQVEPVTSAKVGNVMLALSGFCLVSGAVEMPAWLPRADTPTPTAPGQTAASHPPDPPAASIVGLTNGLLDLRSLIRGDQEGPDEPIAPQPHTPRFFSTVCLPFPFEPAANCPKWEAFALNNLEEDHERIDLLQEWFGYCLTHDTSLQKFLLMEGEGSNGKSVICAALAALLGQANVCHVPLENFGQRFALTQTIGKLANIASEVGEIDKMAEGFLKSFTSGDRMTFDRKNQSAIDALPTARLVLATNNRPRFSDRSGGVWRRMILLPLRVQILDDSQRVHGMDQAEWWQAQGELPGLFNWAVAGLRRIRSRRRFTDPALCREAMGKYRDEANPARLFLRDFYHAQPTSSVNCKELYHAYTRWCQDHGHSPMSEATLGKEVLRCFPSVERKRRGPRHDRFYAYVGIESGSDEDEPTDDELEERVRDSNFFQ